MGFRSNRNSASHASSRRSGAEEESLLPTLKRKRVGSKKKKRGLSKSRNKYAFSSGSNNIVNKGSAFANMENGT